MKKKVVFCYFAPNKFFYTPTDIGYIVAILQQKISHKYDFEILQLKYETTKDEGGDWNLTQKKFIQRDVDLIEYHNPDIIFLFIENVLWSKVFAFGRATKIMEELRNRQSKVFIGLQSYKIQKEQIQRILENDYADCVISGDGEKSLVFMDDILEKKFIPNIYYKINNYPKNGLIKLLEDFENKTCNVSECLDYIPPPYLNHVFDDYIQYQQIINNGNFRAFLVSARGCGFRCYYCFRSTKFEKVSFFSVKRFYDELEYLFNNFKVYNFFILDDAFLYSEERLKEFEDEFRSRLVANPDLKKIDIFLMARPETVDEEKIKLLANFNVKCIQFGLQTVNPDLQHYMGRKIDIIYFKKIKEWLKKYDIKLYLDVVVGLPGDSVSWLKETIRYALLLEPSFVQIKQFYLNPNTLFQVNSSDYDIEIENNERDFDTPYVIKSKNIDDKYFDETDEFIMKQINANPQILWKYLSRKNNFISTNWSYKENNIFKKDVSNNNENSQYYNILWSIKNHKLFILDIDKNNIYLWSSEGKIFAINQLNGNVVWRFNISGINYKKRKFSPPVLHDGKIYFGAYDGNIYCLDKITGKRIWVSLEADWVSSPLVFSEELGLIFVILESGVFNKKSIIVAIDIKNGNKRWGFVANNKILNSLIYISENKLVVFVDEKGNIYSVEDSSGKLKWKNNEVINTNSHLVFDTNKLYVYFVSSTNSLCAFDVNGKKVKLSHSLNLKINSKFFIMDNFIIFSDFEGYLYCFNLNVQKLYWKLKIKEKDFNLLNVINESIFIVTSDEILNEIDLKTGKNKSQLCIKDSVINNIFYSNFSRRFFIETTSGNLYCLVRQTIVHYFKNI